jgi:acyl carrier protein
VISVSRRNPSDESPSTSGGRDVEVEVRIRQYILSTFPFDDPASLGPDTRLLGGPIDSLGLMQLVAFVEDEFGVVFDYEDLTAENFRTIADIQRLVADKQRV